MSSRKRAMHENQRVIDIATDVLTRQVRARARTTGKPFKEALKVVLENEAGRQLGEPRDALHREGNAEDWQVNLVRERVRELKQERAEERKQAEQTAKWERFMQTEVQELELRKAGQLARVLGEPQPGERPVALERLALEDQRQAQEGLVALMRLGKVTYKRLPELSIEDMPARIAANRLRETWLKERRDGWLGHIPDSG